MALWVSLLGATEGHSKASPSDPFDHNLSGQKIPKLLLELPVALFHMFEASLARYTRKSISNEQMNMLCITGKGSPNLFDSMDFFRILRQNDYAIPKRLLQAVEPNIMPLSFFWGGGEGGESH